jgi:SAM-dependent methyltransferase
MSDQPLTELERTLPPHLGGHFGNTNMDEATLDYLIARFGVRSMLDVGCGPGGMVDAAERRDLAVWGIDGDSTLSRDGIVLWDYTIERLWWSQPMDLIWCTEFVEHVEAQYQDNYLATFDAGRVLFLTAAPPGFPGWHHVNCQPQEYWIDLLATRGWTLDTEATAWVRQNGGHIFSQRQGLVFTK